MKSKRSPVRLISILLELVFSGFGQEGVAALWAFVEKGGTLVTFAEAGDFAIQKT